MDELIDIMDADGNPTETSALKSEIHSKGHFHNTIHLWLFTSDGHILLQQRSHKKAIHPLLWDVSVAGHIDSGESFRTAVLRETEEEIGLTLDSRELTKIGTCLHQSEYNEGQIKDYEFHQVYIAQLKSKLANLIPQENEVEALKLVSIPEFKNLVENSATNGHFIPSNKDYYSFVADAITKQLSR
ncbi:NUDIX domain-containing protein [Winogradskyella maritima]|uniref:NUDIX domain-containing protein n=1 Tax=Winogradskyella maritima TaxID=1517766 RepID=A0ABV8AD88_9FLAO|nr:NUDIX domain-containing protein [Winogradskyella maritima]